MMNFLWPELLLLFLILPALVVVYLRLLHRKKKLSMRYASLSIVKEAAGSGRNIRRHVPPLLLLIALTLMIVAIARPAASIALPSHSSTVILAIDTSMSMLERDIEPSRIAAAQSASRQFVAALPRDTRIAIVSFTDTASVVLRPSSNIHEILSAINALSPQSSTAIGSGIFVALQQIFPDIEFGPTSSNPQPSSSATTSSNASPPKEPTRRTDKIKPKKPGSYPYATIILLSDGRSTEGPDPLEASRVAAERGVRIFTVGVGSNTSPPDPTLAPELDERLLKHVAMLTGAAYFYAGTAMDLSKIYKNLHTRLILEKKHAEVTVLFSALATVFALLSGLLSLIWFNRIL
jgi:Ca-activated chloride channel family protein